VVDKSRTMTPTEVGDFIKRRREKLGLTQEQVTERAGITSSNYLSYIENGRVNLARSKYLGAIADVLNLTAEEVLAINPDARITITATERTIDPGAFPIIDDLPSGLHDAIRKYGEGYPQLQDPQIQQYLALARFYTGRGPQTAEQWLAYYLSIASWIGT